MTKDNKNNKKNNRKNDGKTMRPKIKTCWSKVKKFFLRHDRLAEFSASLSLAFITYVIGNFIASLEPNISESLYKFLLIIITIFVFFITEITLYVLFHEDNIVKKISEIRIDTENTMDPNMTAFLEFLAEECYGRCSNQNKDCTMCSLYQTPRCNGLLRNYIHDDCVRIAQSIQKSSKGIYDLNTNIEEYHIIAIKYLMKLKCNEYCVIQKLAVRNEELYDSLDFHFLFSLIENVTSITQNQSKSYVEEQNFKIKWLFVGDPLDADQIKNNYDYIFFVFNKFSNTNIDTFFEFRSISDDTFLAKRQGRTKLNPFISINTPSIGIFGKEFIFVDSPNANLEHGNIYTSNYKDVSDVFTFFYELWNLSKKHSFSNLKQKYNELLNSQPDYEKTLQNRWIKS